MVKKLIARTIAMHDVPAQIPAIMRVALHNQPGIKAMDICQLLYSLSRLGFTIPKDLFDQAVSKAVQKDLNPSKRPAAGKGAATSAPWTAAESVAHLLFAAAKQRHELDYQAFENVTEVFMDCLVHAKFSDIAIVLASVVELERSLPHADVKCMVSELCKKVVKATAPAIAEVLNAAVVFGMQPSEEEAGVLVKGFMENIDQAGPGDVAALLWAAANGRMEVLDADVATLVNRISSAAAAAAAAAAAGAGSGDGSGGAAAAGGGGGRRRRGPRRSGGRSDEDESGEEGDPPAETTAAAAAVEGLGGAVTGAAACKVLWAVAVMDAGYLLQPGHPCSTVEGVQTLLAVAAAAADATAAADGGAGDSERRDSDGAGGGGVGFAGGRRKSDEGRAEDRSSSSSSSKLGEADGAMLYQFCVWASDLGLMQLGGSAEREGGSDMSEEEEEGRGGGGAAGGWVLQGGLSRAAWEWCGAAWHDKMKEHCSKAGTEDRQEDVKEVMEIIARKCASSSGNRGPTAAAAALEDEDEDGDAVMLGVLPRADAAGSSMTIELLEPGSLTEDGVYRVQHGVEVDGEVRVTVELIGALQHLEKGKVQDGTTEARHRGLRQRGWRVVGLDYLEWDGWKRDGVEEERLRDEIERAAGLRE